MLLIAETAWHGFNEQALLEMQPPIVKESTKRASQNNKMHKINATKFFLLETLVLLFNLTRWKPFGKDFV